MRTFWACLIVSLCLHALFFPSALKAMMSSGESVQAVKPPERVKIRLTKKPKPKPTPKKVAVAAKPVVKPKPQVKPRTKPEPLPKPVAARPAPVPPPPKPVPKPVAQPPRPAPRPPTPPKVAVKPSYPKNSPTVNQRTQVPTARPVSSQKRLSSNSKASTRSKVAVSNDPSPSAGGRTGVVDWTPPQHGSSTSSQAEQGDRAGPGQSTETPEPAAPQPVALPEPVAAQPKPPAPLEPPKPKETPKPPKPKSAPQARAALISVPTITPPAKFRRERMKSKLMLRFNIEANGNFEVTLFESSGNPEFDDFVLSEVRKTARVEPAIGDDGQAKRSSPRKPVDINVE